MTKKQALNYLRSSGFSKEQIKAVVDALQGSPTKNDLGVDCIDRAEVLKLMKDNWHTHNGDWAMQESMDDIRALPSVTPIRPKGHWIWCVGSHKCSNCEEYTCFSHKKLLRYCPNCGAKMEEVE